MPMPPASILKPVRGTDREAYENFASFCRLDYPEYEVLFAVSDVYDEILPVIGRLRANFPDRSIRLITTVPRLGTNDKVNNLCQLVQNAKYDLLVMSDSDVRVEPDYLKHVSAPFTDPEVGAVTAFYRSLSAGNLASNLDALGMYMDSPRRARGHENRRQDAVCFRLDHGHIQETSRGNWRLGRDGQPSR